MIECMVERLSENFNRVADARALDAGREGAAISQQVISGSIEADDGGTVAGRLLNNDARRAAEMHGMGADRKKRKEREELHRTLVILQALDRRIAEIEDDIRDLGEQMTEAESRMEEAFAQMHEAEDLREAIKDGVSEDERHRIAELLGKKQNELKDGKLDELLNAYIAAKHQEGLDAQQRVEDLREDRTAKEIQYQELTALQDKIADSSPDEVERIIKTEARSDLVATLATVEPEAKFDEVAKGNTQNQSDINRDYEFPALPGQ